MTSIPSNPKEGQSWRLKGNDLFEAFDSLSYKNHSEIAKLTGYFYRDENEIRILLQEFETALNESQELRVDTGDNEKSFRVVNNRLCFFDSSCPLGLIFVAKKYILAEPDFYNINTWDELTKDFIKEDLIDEYEYSCEEEYEKAINNYLNEFSEPMMTMLVVSMRYLDYTLVSDEDLLAYEQIRPEHIHHHSKWGTTALDSISHHLYFD